MISCLLPWSKVVSVVTCVFVWCRAVLLKVALLKILNFRCQNNSNTSSDIQPEYT